MTDRNDIPYRKSPPLSTKQISRGGPRDMQRRQDVGSANINMPKIDIEALKEVIMNNREMREELKAEIRKEMNEVKEAMVSSKSLEGIGLPFDVVEKKIKEAVEYNEKQIISRYESGLGSLNSQLNSAKSQIKELNNQIIEYKQDISKLKSDIEIKDNQLDELRGRGSEEIMDLKNTLLDIVDKIKSGKITQDTYIDISNRPVLDDKVFIDPLDEVATDLDSYINIDASEAKGNKRDLKSDVEKLKGLLGGGKFKPTRINLEE